MMIILIIFDKIPGWRLRRIAKNQNYLIQSAKMKRNIWDKWAPGVLSRSQMEKLHNNHFLVSDSDIKYGYSSIDLHVSDQCWELTKGSIKPDGQRFSRWLAMEAYAKQKVPNDNKFELDRGETYVLKAKESLKDLMGSHIHGQATARSTIGRVDVLVRLIVDGMYNYDEFNTDQACISGELYLEVTPITFNVVVKPNANLSQLRFFYGEPNISEITWQHYFQNSLLECTTMNNRTLSVDLSPTIANKKNNSNSIKISAYKAKDKDEINKADRLDLTLVDNYDPRKYWTTVNAEENRLTIDPNYFYILRSKEKFALENHAAVYCKAIDETIGEMRIHYAGFVHPFFGTLDKDKNQRSDDQPGTPLIFEVRGHSAKVNLNDGEILAKLIFYRMSEPAKADDDDPTKYSEQTLKLSSLFKDWE